MRTRKARPASNTIGRPRCSVSSATPTQAVVVGQGVQARLAKRLARGAAAADGGDGGQREAVDGGEDQAGEQQPGGARLGVVQRAELLLQKGGGSLAELVRQLLVLWGAHVETLLGRPSESIYED